jgi:hypothetical protein
MAEKEDDRRARKKHDSDDREEKSHHGESDRQDERPHRDESDEREAKRHTQPRRDARELITDRRHDPHGHSHASSRSYSGGSRHGERSDRGDRRRHDERDSEDRGRRGRYGERDDMPRGASEQRDTKQAKLPEDLREFDATFVLSLTEPPHLNHAPLAEMMTQRYGLKQVPIPRDPRAVRPPIRPVLVWAEPQDKLAFDKRLYHVHCGLKNVLHNDKFIIARKDRLVTSFRSLGLERFLPPTHVCEPADSLDAELMTRIEAACGAIKSEDVFIFRPSECYSGMGITILRAPTAEQARAAVEYGRAEGKKLTHRDGAVLVSRYISNLALWRGRKFHMRVYYLVSLIGGTFRSYVWDQGKILSAAKPHVLDHFDDKGVHDTHYKSTDGDPMFPADLIGPDGVSAEVYAHAWANMEDMLTHLSKVYHPKAKLFAESKYGFEVFGLDVLMCSDGKVLIMEANDKIGYNYSTQDFRLQFSKDFFAWLDRTTFAPLLAGAPFPPPLYEAPAAPPSDASQ